MKTDNHVIIKLAELNDNALLGFEKSTRLSKQVLAIAQHLTGKRRLEFLTGRFILAELLQRHWGIDQLPVIKNEVHSKPCFLENTLPDFNISHSDNQIAVALCSQGIIGADIEKHRPRKNITNIAEHFFSKQEVQWLEQQSDVLAAFFRLWTLREAGLKMYAKGVWQMKQLSIDPHTNKICALFANDVYSHYELINAIHLSLCCSHRITRIDIER